MKNERESSRRFSYRKRVQGAIEPKRAQHPRYEWMVECREAGKRVRRFFDDFKQASTFAEQCNTKRENLGRRIEHLNGAELEDAIAARREAEAMGYPALANAVHELKTARDLLAVSGMSLLDAVREVAGRHKTEQASQLVPLAVEELLAAKKANGSSVDYLRDLQSRLGAFGNAFATRPLCSITGAEIESWLFSQGHAPATVALMRRNLSVLWSFARRRGWVAENTVLERTEAPKVRWGTPRILTPEQWTKLLGAAETKGAERGDHRFLWWLLLGGLAGVRPREAERLRWENVRLEMGDVELGAAITKVGSRRLVPVLPALKAFLDRYRPQDATGFVVGLTPTQLRDRRDEACKTAGIEWTPDVLRHSWCSYRVAMVGEAGKVAYEAGHSAAVQSKHYRELCHAKDAEKWFAVQPTEQAAAGKVIPFTAAA
ncbi:tyrosine-type recombinase/integrase [Roseimicrobium sp. ORNL1]|uniref:tyrosine-type recombinase/integrase n=1 Tax=Roseimicrobium sp. ORNL1 TaxID=2711231 RepID=UPI0013E1293F|nr:tyrosine-type recombinase/integrase [Roseimicrobium sp. ORNL1]QIF05190.1 tyrosine-type recombinase/integrase [Roseimicrobium sp. ORNL1]